MQIFDVGPAWAIEYSWDIKKNVQGYIVQKNVLRQPDRICYPNFQEDVLWINPSRNHDTLPTITIGWMMLQHRRSTVDYQCWYNVGKQLAQPYSDCGKSNFPTVDVQGLSSV